MIRPGFPISVERRMSAAEHAHSLDVGFGSRLLEEIDNKIDVVRER